MLIMKTKDFGTQMSLLEEQKCHARCLCKTIMHYKVLLGP